MDGYVLLILLNPVFCFLFSIFYFVLCCRRPANTHRPSLNSSEQRELASRMEKKQLKEFMGVRLPYCLFR